MKFLAKNEPDGGAFRSIVLGIAISLLFVGYPISSAAEPVSLSVYLPILSGGLKSNLENLADDVSNESNGGLELKVIPTQDPPQATLNSLNLGMPDIAVVSSRDVGHMLGISDFSKPFLLNGPYQFQLILNSGLLQHEGQFEFHFLSTWYLGTYALIGREPFHDPATIKNKQIVSLSDFSRFGAKNLVGQFSKRHELFTRGQIDGYETTILDPRLQRLHGAYLSLSNHRFYAATAVINSTSFTALTENHRNILVRKFQEASKRYSSLIVDQESVRLAFLEHGKHATISQVDVPAFTSMLSFSPNVVGIREVGGGTGCDSDNQCKCKTNTYGTKCSCDDECKRKNDCK